MGWNPHAYKILDKDCNDGEEMWEKFVKKHENIFMVLSGQIMGKGVGRLTSRGDHGNDVHQLWQTTRR